MFRKRTPPVGSQPGEFAHVEKSEQPKIRVISYNDNEVEDHQDVSLADLPTLMRSDRVCWVDVQGLGDRELIQKIGLCFELHPLVMADVVNVPNRPKVEEHENYIFVIMAMMSISIEVMPIISSEQMSFFIGKNWVLSLQEWYGDDLDPVRDRIFHKKGAIRKSGSDYLAYALIDTLVDGYYPVVEKLGDYLENLEDEVIKDPTRSTASRIFSAKRQMLELRHSIWPLRELLSSLIKLDNKLLKKTTRIYLQDTYDHCVQIMDVVETYRELCAGFTDLYLSGISNRLNEVMKVLTMISTIFIPLSFIVGLYGMNFHYMPELEYRWSYPILLGVMVALASCMLLYFKRKGWFEPSDR